MLTEPITDNCITCLFKIHVDEGTGITIEHLESWYNDQGFDGICLLQEVADITNKVHYQGIIHATFRTRKQIRNSFDVKFGKRGQGKTSISSFKSNVHLENYLPYVFKGTGIGVFYIRIVRGTILGTNYHSLNNLYWKNQAIKKIKKNNGKTTDENYLDYMDTFMTDEPLTHDQCLQRTIEYFGHHLRKGFLPVLVERYSNLYMFREQPSYWTSRVSDIIAFKYKFNI